MKNAVSTECLIQDGNVVAAEMGLQPISQNVGPAPIGIWRRPDAVCYRVTQDNDRGGMLIVEYIDAG